MLISKKMQKRICARSPIRVAFERATLLKSQGKEVFDFSIGNPTSICPDQVKSAIEKCALTDPSTHGYMPAEGYDSVREKIADKLSADHGIAYTSKNIVMTNGAAGGLNNVLHALIDEGDEVIQFLPAFAAYEVYVDNYGGKLVSVDFDETTFMPDIEKFEQAITEKTKVVIVNTPNNPSGVVYDEQMIRELADVLESKEQEFDHPIVLLSDEPYRDLVYDGQRALWWPNFYENTLVCYSFSKSASVAGERIGYVAITPTISDCNEVRCSIVESVGDLGFVNAPAISQRIAEECCDISVDISYYDGNRKLLSGELKRLGFEFPEPLGAFYIMLKAPDGDQEAFLDALSDEQIIAVSGTAFGAPGYVRLAYCLPTDDIKASIPHFENVAKKYGIL